MARRGRAAVGLRHRRETRADRGADRGRRGVGHSRQRRLQRRHAGRRSAITSSPPATACAARRPPRICGPRERAATCGVETEASRDADRLRRPQGFGRPLPPGGTRCERGGKARGDPRPQGALQSPQLLQLSGVGPPALLQEFGIPVVHRLAGVGENLQDHLQARVIFRCTKPITTNDVLNSALAHSGDGLCRRRATRPDGGRDQPGRHLRAHRPALARPDVQFHVATLSSDMAGSKVHAFSGFTMSVCQLQPESRGHVRLKSPDPLAAPAMQPNYLSTAKDRATLVAGIRLARALAATRALSPYVAGEYRPGPEATSDDALLEFAKNTAGRSSIRPARARWDRRRIRSRSVDHDLASARPRRDSRRRLQHHADAGFGQHQRAGRDDRRKDCRPNPLGKCTLILALR